MIFYHSGILEVFGSPPPSEALRGTERPASATVLRCAAARCPVCGTPVGLRVAQKGSAYCQAKGRRCRGTAHRECPVLAQLLEQAAQLLHKAHNAEGRTDTDRARDLAAVGNEAMHYIAACTDLRARWPVSIHFEQIPAVVVRRYLVRYGLTPDRLADRIVEAAPHLARDAVVAQLADVDAGAAVRPELAGHLAAVFGIPAVALTAPGTWTPLPFCLPPLPEEVAGTRGTTRKGLPFRVRRPTLGGRMRTWHEPVAVPDYSHEPTPAGPRGRAWFRVRLGGSGESRATPAGPPHCEVLASGSRFSAGIEDGTSLTEPLARVLTSVRRQINAYEALRWGKPAEPLEPSPASTPK